MFFQVEHAFCLSRLNGYNLHDLPDGKVRTPTSIILCVFNIKYLKYLMTLISIFNTLD